MSLIAQESPDAIFILNCNEGNPPRHSLSRKTPEYVIHELTDGIISVTSSTTFVITEASTDENAYRTIFETLTSKGILQKNPNLVFLRATEKGNDGYGGGKGQVRNWSEKLTEAGLPNFKGIIDCDYGNTAKPPIYVLDRYAIENLLLDPILIFARLVEKRLHTKLLNNEFPEIFKNNHNISLLNEQKNEDLQRIADAVCSSVREVKDKGGNEIEGITSIKYFNGKQIEVPKWFLYGYGKKLKKNVEARFDRSRRNGDRAFANLDDMTNILTRNIPEFTPCSLIDLFEKLQSTSSAEVIPVQTPATLP